VRKLARQRERHQKDESFARRSPMFSDALAGGNLVVASVPAGQDVSSEDVSSEDAACFRRIVERASRLGHFNPTQEGEVATAAQMQLVKRLLKSKIR
jgi:hypothetical protein